LLSVGPGCPTPLGATWDGAGTNFAISAPNATAVELCLFAQPGDGAESQRVELRGRTGPIWHAYVPGIGPGQAYGYRVHGPYAPAAGHRFNPAKLLLDPYAKAISGSITWTDALTGYPVWSTDPARDLIQDPVDSAAAIPKCVVVDSSFAWDDDQHPRTPWDRTVIYECHVKGMTMLHPEVPERLRGTYLGLATDPIIHHLNSLGVTAIELLPVHHIASERRLVEQGLTNYWGYSTIGYFAPDIRYASGSEAGMAGAAQVSEFKTMVKRFHQAGIEVLLDVVYNHTAEGNHLGPTLSFRGIDNAGYYRPHAEGPRFYADFTGCGNTVDLRHPQTRQLVVDSLRYWVEEMHVDGFRFDIAPVLARDDTSVNMGGDFFRMVRQDPIISQVKLIAEPWDLGPDGYQLGRFPPGWSEWNDKYRNTVRRFWRGDQGQVGDLASRLAGSSDLYAAPGRSPQASVNFVTCHDGFTLHDLVSYETKHNLANGEQNRDGTDYNLSRNWGVEGPTESVRTVHIRERMKRNFLATLAFSQGVPMLSHGDELGRTQSGNNNAYCQDSPLTWIDWQLSPIQRELLQFTRGVFALRAATPELRRNTFFRQNGGEKDQSLTWLRADGGEMSAADWGDPANHLLGMLVRGGPEAADAVEGHRPDRAALLLLLNASGRAKPFTLPALGSGTWTEMVNTHPPGSHGVRKDCVNLGARSLTLLQYHPGERPG
jgi:isoamylase